MLSIIYIIHDGLQGIFTCSFRYSSSKNDFYLQQLEDMLVGFQSELGTICSDMKRLQQQSIDISQQLQNRQKVRGELSQFVDDMVVSHNMIQ